MKKIVVFSLIFTLLKITTYGQYATPGTGISWDLDDLVANSAGVVSFTDPAYSFHADLIVSPSDTLRLEENNLVRLDAGVLVTVQGVLHAAPPDSLVFTATDTLQHFKGFRFEDSDASVLKRCVVEFGGGLDILNSDLLIELCTFRKNDKSNSTGVVDLFFSNPLVKNCSFYYNEGPAVMSGANSDSSPFIQGNVIYRNNTVNANMPQINLGTSAPEIPIRIVGNVIEGYYNKAGGIAVTTLAGGELDCIIDSNQIYNNRYGITAYGFDITSVISNNKIYGNNIENIPMQGGSGINYWGGTSNTSMVFGNEIYDNLWGITVTGDAIANMGQVEPDTINPGGNKLYDNGNLGTVYALYNNTPNDLYAENNFWGSYSLDSVELVIFHYPDDETLGMVDYLPMMDSLTTAVPRMVESPNLKAFPNPADTYFTIVKPASFDKSVEARVLILDDQGRTVHSQAMTGSTLRIDLGALPTGVYIVSITDGTQGATTRLLKH